MWTCFHLYLYRVAVPVLVKDGKPCSGSDSSDADTGQVCFSLLILSFIIAKDIRH